MVCCVARNVYDASSAHTVVAVITGPTTSLLFHDAIVRADWIPSQETVVVGGCKQQH
jgi:hypothetical protein